MTESEVKDYLLSGGAFWHWPMGIVIFYDEDFDEDGDANTFGVTMLDLWKMKPNDLWEGYNPGNDDSIDRDTAARIIAGTPGWLKTDDPMVSDHITLMKSCALGYRSRDMHYMLDYLNNMATADYGRE